MSHYKKLQPTNIGAPRSPLRNGPQSTDLQTWSRWSKTTAMAGEGKEATFDATSPCLLLPCPMHPRFPGRWQRAQWGKREVTVPQTRTIAFAQVLLQSNRRRKDGEEKKKKRVCCYRYCQKVLLLPNLVGAHRNSAEMRAHKLHLQIKQSEQIATRQVAVVALNYVYTFCAYWRWPCIWRSSGALLSLSWCPSAATRSCVWKALQFSPAVSLIMDCMCALAMARAS